MLTVHIFSASQLVTSLASIFWNIFTHTHIPHIYIYSMESRTAHCWRLVWFYAIASLTATSVSPWVAACYAVKVFACRTCPWKPSWSGSGRLLHSVITVPLVPFQSKSCGCDVSWVLKFYGLALGRRKNVQLSRWVVNLGAADGRCGRGTEPLASLSWVVFACFWWR